MKTTLLLFLLLPSIAFSQQIQSTAVDAVDIKIDHAGEHLQKASKGMIYGISVSLVGTALALLAPTFYKEPNPPTLQPATSQSASFANAAAIKKYNADFSSYNSNVSTLRTIGLASAGVGSLISITAIIHIGQAGKSLRK